MRPITATATAMAMACAMIVSTPVPPVVSAQDRDVTLTGCLMTGEGDDGYVLTNAGGGGKPGVSEAVTPGPVGTAGGASTTLYWLEDDDALKTHVGHRVEIAGQLTGDIEPGQIEIERERTWTELRIKSDGDNLTVRIPQSVVVISGAAATDQKIDVLVRKVDVDRVRMLAASCE